VQPKGRYDQISIHWWRICCAAATRYGDSECTFSDVERAIQREIDNRNYLARNELRLAEEQQVTDLALVRQLKSKYSTTVGEQDLQPRPLAVPQRDQTHFTPIQGSLF
jgi:hypothetical protein